jgi:predicted nucleic acid-binding Zn ribbon protein
VAEEEPSVQQTMRVVRVITTAVMDWLVVQAVGHKHAEEMAEHTQVGEAEEEVITIQQTKEEMAAKEL